MEDSPKNTLTVNTSTNTYNIYIGNYFSTNNFNNIKNYLTNSIHIIVVDKTLKNIYLSSLINYFNNNNYKYIVIPIKANDKNKNFNQLNKIINTALKHNIDRKSVLIALGGGTIGDLGGFAASILLRGIRYINIPTTLLSQVDSSVGGKTGINSKFGKNLVGSFYPPSLVIIDLNTLKTLKKRELLAGFSEVIKYALIFSTDFFNYLYNNHNYLTTNYNKFWENIIYKSCLFKKQIVEQDEKETQNIRAILNFGHSFGHALEKLNNYKSSLLHGEAVAIGMCIATKLSCYLNLINTETSNKIINFIKDTNLPTDFNHLKINITSKKLINAMMNDKKNNNNSINLILLKNLGEAIYTPNISIETLQSFLEKEYFQKC